MKKLYVFIHIPKTAGSTVNSIFYWFFPIDRIIKGVSKNLNFRTLIVWDTEFDENGGRSSSIDSISRGIPNRLKLIHGHLPMGVVRSSKEIIPFTFLREPVSRVMSFYNYVSNNENHHLHEFIRGNDIQTIIDRTIELDNLQTRFLCGLETFKIPVGKLNDGHLEKAIDNLQNVIVSFGLVERFDESLLLMQKEMGIKKKPLYVTKNISEKKRIRKESAADNIIDTLKKQNQLDIKLYDFAYELFNKRMEKIDSLDDKLAEFKILNENHNRIYKKLL